MTYRIISAVLFTFYVFNVAIASDELSQHRFSIVAAASIPGNNPKIMPADDTSTYSAIAPNFYASLGVGDEYAINSNISLDGQVTYRSAPPPEILIGLIFGGNCSTINAYLINLGAIFKRSRLRVGAYASWHTSAEADFGNNDDCGDELSERIIELKDGLGWIARVGYEVSKDIDLGFQYEWRTFESNEPLATSISNHWWSGETRVIDSVDASGFGVYMKYTF